MNSRPKYVDSATGALTPNPTATSNAPIFVQDPDRAPASLTEVDFDYWDVDASTMDTVKPAKASHIDYEFGMVLNAPRASPDRASTATLGVSIEFDLEAGWPTEWESPDFAAQTPPGKTYAHQHDYDDNHEYDYEYDFAYDYNYDLRFAMEQPIVGTHAVLFFDDEAVRLLEVVNFVCEGVRAGESVFLALTSSIAESVRAALPADVLALAQRSEGLTILDAHATLELLMRDGTLDPAAFEKYVASGVRRSRKERGPVRVYGEMVTLLWSADNVVAALQLEQLWNELQEEFGVTVLCAYPLALVAEGTEEFARVSQCHNKTIVR